LARRTPRTPATTRLRAQVVVIGPGDLAQAHRKDEWLERDQLVRAIALDRATPDLADRLTIANG
jgi:acetylornithine deacetylase/succinyl-diaminopimelate desuccinylase-like protein